MFGYSMVCSKKGHKTQYYPLDDMLDNDINLLLLVMEGYGYNVELIKDWGCCSDTTHFGLSAK